MSNYIIPEEILVPIINYLSGRPYSEVYKVMPIITTLQKIEENKDDD